MNGSLKITMMVQSHFECQSVSQGKHQITQQSKTRTDSRTRVSLSAQAFDLVAAADGLALQNGEASWMSVGPSGEIARTGEASGVLERVDATTWKLAAPADGGCEITVKRIGPDWLDADDNHKCGGLNVTFNGRYRRAP